MSTVHELAHRQMARHNDAVELQLLMAVLKGWTTRDMETVEYWRGQSTFVTEVRVQGGKTCIATITSNLGATS